ncbi:hypothetical protein, partial [Candidatus Brocadia sapporoensis]|uniref:hypothetical protein n=1 Tax=Candidatus Brocadia sapporoensis TaxID=392547 RepID=UPI001E46C3A1
PCICWLSSSYTPRIAKVGLSVNCESQAKRYCALGVVAANLHKQGNVLQERRKRSTRSCLKTTRNSMTREILSPDKSKMKGNK